MSSSKDVVLIGGGVIGLSLAWELARRGREVCLLESNERFGREASWAGAGMLPATPPNTTNVLDQLMGFSRRLHEEWATRLLEQVEVDNGFEINGALYIARTRGERASLRAWQSDIDELGLDSRWVEPDELQQCEPALNHGELWGACELPGEAQLRNPDHIRALVEVCRLEGVELRAGESVRELQLREMRIGTTKDTLQAKQVCVTAGPWTRQLLEGLSWIPDIYPVRGQMVLFRSPDGRQIQHTINEGPRYLVPRQDGRVLAGSTEEEVGFVRETTTEAVEELKRFAWEVAPFLRRCEVQRSWAGLRPAAFDGFPYLGKIPGTERAFIAAGHFRNGLNLSTGTAVLMAQLICDEPLDRPLDRFDPAR